MIPIYVRRASRIDLAAGPVGVRAWRLLYRGAYVASIYWRDQPLFTVTFWGSPWRVGR